MQESNTPSLQAATPSVQSGGGNVYHGAASSQGARLTPSDSAHVLRSMAEYAEGRAQSDALNETTARRLRRVADRLRTHAADFSAPHENES